MQSASSRIWTRVTVSISCDDNHDTTGTYIYIYIVIHRQTFRSIRTLPCGWTRRTLEPGSKPVQLYVRLNLRPLGQQAYHVGKGIFLRYYVATAAASVCLHFYTLSTTRVLNSFEELCIMRAAAENSFARVLNPYGGASFKISEKYASA